MCRLISVFCDCTCLKVCGLVKRPIWLCMFNVLVAEVLRFMNFFIDLSLFVDIESFLSYINILLISSITLFIYLSPNPLDRCQTWHAVEPPQIFTSQQRPCLYKPACRFPVLQFYSISNLPIAAYNSHFFAILLVAVVERWQCICKQYRF